MVSHSMYGMKRAVHKTSESEIIYKFFVFVLAHQFFIPYFKGRKVSMVLYAAFGFILQRCTGPVVSHSLCCNLRAVHKLS